MYPNSLAINKFVLDFFRLKTELESLKGSRDALLINNEIKDLEPQMSWPPKEDDLKPSRANDYVPYLLDVFLTVLQFLGNRSTVIAVRQKNNKAERIFWTGYCFFCYEWGCENSKKRVFSFCCKGPL